MHVTKANGNSNVQFPFMQKGFEPLMWTGNAVYKYS